MNPANDFTLVYFFSHFSRVLLLLVGCLYNQEGEFHPHPLHPLSIFTFAGRVVSTDAGECSVNYVTRGSLSAAARTRPIIYVSAQRVGFASFRAMKT